MRDIDFFTKLLSLKRPWKVDGVSLSLEEGVTAVPHRLRLSVPPDSRSIRGADVAV
jgi:hypothetical protein